MRQAFLFACLCINHSIDLHSLGVTPGQIKAFCQKHYICRLAFFGSMVREDSGQHSDLDVLVEFEPGDIPGYDLFLIEAELSNMLGHKVDLQTAHFLDPEVRQTTLAEAVTAHEQA